jgi:hypothetical protein
MAAAAARLDEGVQDLVLGWVGALNSEGAVADGLDPSTVDTCRAVLKMPPKFGGIGLRRLFDLRASGYAASLALANAVLRPRMGVLEFSPDSEEATVVAEEAATLSISPRDFLTLDLADEFLDNLQRRLTCARETRSWVAFYGKAIEAVNDSYNTDRHVLLANMFEQLDPVARAWLRAPPSSETELYDEQTIMGLAVKMGLPTLTLGEASCSQCGQPVGWSRGQCLRHPLVCDSNRPVRRSAHDMVRAAVVAKLWREVRPPVEVAIERSVDADAPPVPGGGVRGDVRLKFMSGRTVNVDVATVTSEIGGRVKTVNWSSDDELTAMRLAAARLMGVSPDVARLQEQVSAAEVAVKKVKDGASAAVLPSVDPADDEARTLQPADALAQRTRLLREAEVEYAAEFRAEHTIDPRMIALLEVVTGIVDSDVGGFTSSAIALGKLAWTKPHRATHEWQRKLLGTVVDSAIKKKEAEKKAKGCEPFVVSVGGAAGGGIDKFRRSLPRHALKGDGKPRFRMLLSVTLLRGRARVLRVHRAAQGHEHIVPGDDLSVD